jgi:ABC-type antimicrobial peptide transport system permease subunit
LWAPLTALLGMVFGLVAGSLSFFFIAFCMSPRILWSIVRPLWTQPLPKRSAASRTGNDNIDNDPCVMCCQCCLGSINECFWLLAIPFKLAATLVVFVFVLLYIPVALLLGLVQGTIAGLLLSIWRLCTDVFTWW